MTTYCRSIELTDLSALSNLYRPYAGKALNEQMVAQAITDYPSSCLVRDYEIIGFAYCLRLAPDVLELANIYVELTEQGRGSAGGAVLSHLLATAADQWTAVIAANSFLRTTLIEKKDPTNFYLRNGFSVIAQTRDTKLFWRLIEEGRGGGRMGANEHSISLVSALSGPNSKIGSGIKASGDYILARYARRLRDRGIILTINAHDDHDSAAYLRRVIVQAEKNGDLAVVVGSSSPITEEVLKSLPRSRVPILCTYATSSVLSRIGHGKFYRFQSNDRDRVEALVGALVDRCESAVRGVDVYVLQGAPECYANRLYDDVVVALGKRSIEHATIAFTPFNVDKSMASNRPAIICSPSAEAVILIRALRKRGRRQPLFGFGSNTNFLHAECEGLIIVSDTDRMDQDPKRRSLINGFCSSYPAETEPSIPTMIAVSAVVNHLLSLGRPRLPFYGKGQQFSTYLDQVPRGPLGAVSFDEHGELIGKDYHISTVLRRRDGSLYFDSQGVSSAPSRFRLDYRRLSVVTRSGWKVVAVVSTAAGAVPVIGWIVSWL